MFENWRKLVSSYKIDLVQEKITFYIIKTRWEVYTYMYNFCLEKKNYFIINMVLESMTCDGTTNG